MKNKKAISLLNILTVSSFVCFVLVFGYYVFSSIDPDYIQGLVFAIPFVAFLGISLLENRKTIGKKLTNVFTMLVFVFSVVVMPINFLFITFDEATASISDISKYERVMDVVGYPDYELVQNFPGEMPEAYKLINFRYNPAFMQADEELILDYQTSSEELKGLADNFSTAAIWSGTPNDEECVTNGLDTLDFRWLMEKDEVPSDLFIYLFYSEPVRGGYNNHARFSLAAISFENSEVLYYMEDY